MSDAKALAWAKKFTTQKPHYSPNLTQTEAPIESGQVSIRTTLINPVLHAKAKGAPADIAPVSPTTANEAYLYVPKGAPHPAAAALVTSFLSSDDAQSVPAKTYNSRIPAATDCSSPGDNTVLQSMCKTNPPKWFPTANLDDHKSFSTFFPEAEKALGTDVGWTSDGRDGESRNEREEGTTNEAQPDDQSHAAARGVGRFEVPSALGTGPAPRGDRRRAGHWGDCRRVRSRRRHGRPSGDDERHHQAGQERG
ncbi:hypothetical protein ACFVDQ_31420 [Streptomyces sp. NPDC057684]|uniref:hypothetical protein n=1 Tax=Streptomyces sp. NPDC057684 TaxID=3346211 RepID=UPI0036B7EFF9